MELQKALKEVREQKIAPVYLLIGTELYLTELFKTTLMKRMINLTFSHLIWRKHL